MYPRKKDHSSVNLAAKALTYVIAAICAAGVIAFAIRPDTADIITVVETTAQLQDPNQPLNSAHAFFNSVVAFNVDPWLAALTQITGLTATEIYWLICVVGLIALKNGLSAVLSASLVAFTFGLDRSLLGILAWLPMASLLVFRFQRRGELALLIILLFIGMRLTYAAGPLTVISLGLLVVISEFGSKSDAELGRKRLALCALALGVIASLRSIPELPHFDYPVWDALASPIVVPDDGVPGVLQPLVGPAFALQVIDLQSTKDFLLLPLWLTVATLSLSIPVLSRGALIGVAIVLGCIGFDLFTEGQLTILGPLATLSRMLPGLFLYPAAALALALSLWVIIARNAPLRAAVLAILCVAVLQIRSDRAETIISGAEKAGFSALQISSPSLAILRRSLDAATASRKLATERSTLTEFEWLPCNATVEISTVDRAPVSAADLAPINDSNPKTRISLGQRKGNKVALCFAENNVAGVDLNVGDFKTDYPQHFIVRDRTTRALLGNFDPWLGPIEVSSFLRPYHSSPINVRMILPSDPATSPRCIEIELTADNRGFDWSIAELRCLKIGPRRSDL